jgi:alpha-acetolactate decarboxylase
VTHRRARFARSHLLAASLAMLGSIPLARAGRGAPAPAPVQVETFGSLRDIIHAGRLEGRAALSAALSRPHAYALGALARLDGEFVIVDGKVWETRPGERGSLRATAYAARADSAALMVVSHVTGWHDIPVMRAIPIQALQETLAARATLLGLPRSGPFPFLIEGPVTGLRWHVADGRLLARGPSSHEAHLKASVHGARDSISVTLVGFYSDHHQGVFTHHDSQVHMHVLLAAEAIAAHVDSVCVSPGAVLRLPIVR